MQTRHDMICFFRKMFNFLYQYSFYSYCDILLTKAEYGQTSSILISKYHRAIKKQCIYAYNICFLFEYNLSFSRLSQGRELLTQGHKGVDLMNFGYLRIQHLFDLSLQSISKLIISVTLTFLLPRQKYSIMIASISKCDTNY